jgi:hypothetical protein
VVDHDYSHRRILLKLDAILLQIHRRKADDAFAETASHSLSQTLIGLD